MAQAPPTSIEKYPTSTDLQVRDLIVSKYFCEDKKEQEIADELQISIGNVSKSVYIPSTHDNL